MRIDGSSLPAHIQHAYGLKSVARVQPVQPVAKVSPVQSSASLDATASRPVELSSKMASLVAGQVKGPVDFNLAGPQRPNDNPASGPFQLYNRVADRVEAAIAVQVGRAVDIKG